MTAAKTWPAKLDPDLWAEVQRRWNAQAGMERELAQLRRLRKAAIELTDFFFDLDNEGELLTPKQHATLVELLQVLDNALTETRR